MTKQQIKVAMLNAGCLTLLKNLDAAKMSKDELEERIMTMQQIILEETAIMQKEREDAIEKAKQK